MVLAASDELVGLLHRADVLSDADEADHVARQATRELDDELLRPLLEGRVPRQGHQLRVGLGGQDPHGHRATRGSSVRAMRRVVLLPVVLLLCVSPALAGGPEEPVGGEVELGKAEGLKHVAEQVMWDTNFESLSVACGANNGPWHPTGGGVTMSATRADSIEALGPMDLDAPLESPDNLKLDDYWKSSVGMAVGTQITAWAVCTKRPTSYVLADTPDARQRNGPTPRPAPRGSTSSVVAPSSPPPAATSARRTRPPGGRGRHASSTPPADSVACRSTRAAGPSGT